MDVAVSIICNSYNHGRYIRDTLEGFVNQKTSFKFEVLINDDASTDDTALIIKEYEEKYPNIIKPIYQSENQYSKKISITREIQLPRVRGKYIAICEGDDYWTDVNKLQRQFDILESNSSIDMCAHKAEEIDGNTGDHIRWIAPKNGDYVLSLEQVIKGGGSYLATASLFYRKEIDTDPVSFRKAYSLDYTLQVAGALRGGIYYIDLPMSVYRGMTPGSWTLRARKSPKIKIEHKKRMREIFRLMDKETEKKYHSYFVGRIFDNRLRTILLEVRDVFHRNR